MKKPKFLCLVPIMVLTGVFCSCTAAVDGGGDNVGNSTPSKPKPVEPESNGITLDPGKVWGVKGTTIPFMATVEDSSDTLTWTVLGSSTGDEAPERTGMIYRLTVDENETSESLTVRAALPDDSTTKGEAIVWILGNEESVITNGLAVRPQSIMLGPGDNKVFNAYTVAGEEISEEAAEGVTWTVTGASNTTIGEDNGELTVSSDETAKTFTVTATKEGMTGTAIVTVLGNEEDPAPVSGGIYLSPQRDVVKKGRTTVFKAYAYNADREQDEEIITGLEWTVFGATDPVTGMSDDGTLAAADGEEAQRLTVRATTADGHYGTAVVTVIDPNTFNSVQAVSDYLYNVSGGTTKKPIALPLYINLTEYWEALLTAINDAEKHVSLDLSDCWMSTTTFDPGMLETGKNYIASLILPDAATSVKAATGSLSTTSGTPSFRYFTGIKSIEGKNVTSIGKAAFYNLTSLTSINFPSATSISEYAFIKCTALTSVNLPSAATIGDYAFYQCAAIESAILPMATTIGSYAFYGCTGMSPASITSVKTIGSYAFQGCSSLESVNLLAATSIGIYAFQVCTGLRTATLPAATSIGTYAFQGCTGLRTATLPAATSIGERAFYNCTKLESVELPAATSIGEHAFYNCTKLESVSLPAALTTIGSNPFAGCTSLTSLSVASDNANFSVQGGGRMLLNKDGDTLFSYPTATGSVTLASLIENIGKYAFYSCAVLTSVSSESVASIGERAFYNCTKLESVNLPAATDIGERAFYNCSLLLSATLTDATSIGERAFYNCSRLESVNLPAATNIGTYAFYNCSLLLSATLTSATSIGSYAFQNCAKLASVSLPKVASIGEYAFTDCKALGPNVTFGDHESVTETSIGTYAFQNCTTLESVSGPNVKSIGTYAFQNCTKLASVSGPNVKSIGTYAFYGCALLASVNLPEATSIDNYAFRDCKALQTVTFDSAISIGTYAFYNCIKLESASLLAATSIGTYAFAYCTLLEDLYLPSIPPTLVNNTAFSYTVNSSNIEAVMTIHLPAGGNVNNYTTNWEVDAQTNAYVKSGKYGTNHKAITITSP